MRIPIAVLVELGAVGIRNMMTMDVNENVEIKIILAAIAAFQLKVGSGAFEFAELLMVYDPLAKRFLDTSRTLSDEGVAPDTPLIVTTISDAARLDEMVIIRELTDIERLALEIRRGQ